MIVRPVHIDMTGKVIEMDWRPGRRDRRRATWRTDTSVVNAVHDINAADMFNKAIDPLEDWDIRFSGPGEPFEISIAGIGAMSRAALETWNQGPLIIHDYRDTADLSPIARICLLSDKIVGMFKPRILRNYEDNSLPLICMPAHKPTSALTRLADALPPWFDRKVYPRQPVMPHVPKEIIDRKVRLCPGFSHIAKFDQCWDTLALDRPRSYDCFFAGSKCYENWIVTLHRTCMSRAIWQMRNDFHVLCKDRIDDFSTYWATLLQTKVAPSPWGHAISCYRDFEAIMAGAVLLKPESVHCVTWPDLFHPESTAYVRCKPDFSDLRERVVEIRDTWESPEREEDRADAWALLHNACQPCETADYLATGFRYFASLL